MRVKFRSFADVAKYTDKLREKCTDPDRRQAEIIDKGAKGARAPHIIRRGDALTPFYGVFVAGLRAGEGLHQHHVMKCTTCTRF